MYFEYNTNDLANAGISVIPAARIPESADAPVVSDSMRKLDFYGASVIFRSKIAVRYYFAGDVSGCTFTANGKSYTPVAKDGKYYVEIGDVLPQNLDKDITLTVTDTAGNTLCVTYGPMDYIVRMNQTGSENLQDLVKALYAYHIFSQAYAMYH